MSQQYTRHRLSAIYPEFKAEEAASMDRRMKEHGFDVDQPVILIGNEVLDGWNRYQSALRTGIQPITRQWQPSDGTPLQYVLRHNSDRRHITPSEAAAIAVEMLPLIKAEREELANIAAKTKADAPPVQQPLPGTGGPPPEVEDENQDLPTEEELVEKLFGVKSTMLALAKSLKKNAPDLFERVLKNDLTVNAAKSLYEQRQADERAQRNRGKEGVERTQALEEIREKHGKESEVARAAEKKTILKAHDDLLIFAGLSKAEGKKLVPLLNQGWSVEKAQKYLGGKLGTQSTVEDLINALVVHKSKNSDAETLEIEIAGHWLTISKAEKKPE